MTTTLEQIVIDTGGDPSRCGEKWRPSPPMAGYDIAFTHNDSMETVYSHKEVYHTTKARLQNKPSWVERAKYRAQEKSGAWHMFECEPKELGGTWYSASGDTWSFMSDGQVIGFWRDTLEVRPDELQYNPDDVAFKFDESEIEGTVLFNGEIGGEWLGPEDGLPAVGCECEIILLGGAKESATITYVGDGVFCYRAHDSGREYTGDTEACLFRPLQSERERWVEAAVKIIANEFDATAEDCLDAAYAIFDAGLGRLPE